MFGVLPRRDRPPGFEPDVPDDIQAMGDDAGALCASVGTRTRHSTSCGPVKQGGRMIGLVAIYVGMLTHDAEVEMERRNLLRLLGGLPAAGLLAGLNADAVEAVPLSNGHTLLLVRVEDDMTHEDALRLKQQVTQAINRDDVTVVVTDVPMDVQAISLGQPVIDYDRLGSDVAAALRANPMRVNIDQTPANWAYIAGEDGPLVNVPVSLVSAALMSKRRRNGSLQGLS